MKRALILFTALLLITGNTALSQGLLKKVTKSMTDELLGKTPSLSSSGKTAEQPEPESACKDGILVIDLSGKLQLNYTELNITTGEDGSLLINDIVTGDYYISRSGTTTGPVKEGDPRLAAYDISAGDEGSDQDIIPPSWNKYVQKNGEKYTITFNGKTYGPYAIINDFAVSGSKEKFAAIVTENIVVTESQGKAIEEELKKAKTDLEKMELAMKYSAQLQQNMMQGGGPQSTMPVFITNVEGAAYDPLTGGTLRGNMKYDDILAEKYLEINDLRGNKILALKDEMIGSDIFISNDNSKWAYFQYGTLYLNDNTSLPELFNPVLKKEGGKIFLAYMYYSPKKNAIMECRLPF